MDDETQEFGIRVKRVGTKEIDHREAFTGTRREVDNRATDIWNDKYSTQPGRFKLSVYQKGVKAAITVIG
ncbi:hypothetical protein [Sphingomonas sp. 3-13AW]|uniref:hypothetical protein n=1 Tax=Sphingomonas sp. 3-13AW TaxID=3050450 RepID=UPI003BB6F4DF